MRQKIFILSCCFFSAVVCIAGLYFLSNRPNSFKNGFIRHYPPHIVKEKRIKDLTYNSYYIAGSTASKIYLANFVLNKYLVVTNWELTDTQHIDFSFIANDTAMNTPYKYYLDSPDVYITDEQHFVVYHATLEHPATIQKKYTGMAFSSFASISGNSFIIGRYDAKLDNYLLIKEDMNDTTIVVNTNAIEKQGEGFFSTDGMLLYNKQKDILNYIYFYRNQFICLDTSLKLMFRENTIDTISLSNIKTGTVDNGSLKKLAAPPLIVNRFAAANSDWFYVNSRLKADNENKALFDENSVIDMYSAKDRRYYYSFYLPEIDHKKITAFHVYKNRIAVINEHTLATYLLNLP